MVQKIARVLALCSVQNEAFLSASLGVDLDPVQWARRNYAPPDVV